MPDGHATYNDGRCAVQLFWAYAEPQIMQIGSAKPALLCSTGVLVNSVQGLDTKHQDEQWH